jgi:hypothetical protein
VFKTPTGIPPLPTITGISAGYYITNGSPIVVSASTDSADPAPLLEVYGSPKGGGGGLKFSTIRGNIDLSTRVGNFAMSNSTSFVADITEPFKDPTTTSILKSLRPGMYAGSQKSDLSLFSSSAVTMFAGKNASSPPADKYIKVSLAALDIVNQSGIYLN